MSSQAVAWAISMQIDGGSKKAVLLSIANYADEYGESFAGQETIAAGAGVKVRQCRTIINALIELGFLERTRRGGEGKGRQSDVIRLRMREIPAIITAKRRDTQATGNIEQPAIIAARATGNFEGGNRQSVAGEPNNPNSPSKRPPKGGPKGSPSIEADVAAVIAAARPHFSKTGAKRLRPIPARKALEPLLARHGLEAVSAAARRFYADPYQHRDGGDFQPGLQVIANDGRLEALIQAAPTASDGPDWAKRYALHDADGTWLARWGPPPGDPFHEGPRKEAAA